MHTNNINAVSVPTTIYIPPVSTDKSPSEQTSNQSCILVEPPNEHSGDQTYIQSGANTAVENHHKGHHKTGDGDPSSASDDPARAALQAVLSLLEQFQQYLTQDNNPLSTKGQNSMAASTPTMSSNQPLFAAGDPSASGSPARW